MPIALSSFCFLTFNVFWKSSIDLLVCLECLLVVAGAAVAGSHHELPLGLVRLHECSSLKIADCFLRHLMFNEV